MWWLYQDGSFGGVEFTLGCTGGVVTIRSLTNTEKDTLRKALICLKRTSAVGTLEHWASIEMLTMLDDLLWIESKEGQING